MKLKVDFNNPRILLGYKEQVLLQVGLDDCAVRILVGYNGGLAYKLFPDRYDKFPLQFRITSASEMGSVHDFFNSVQTYVKDAEKHAKKHGFGLVTVSGRNDISNGYDPNGFIYDARLGSANIESAGRFGAFLEMIKSGKSKLDEQYGDVVERAKLFPCLQNLLDHDSPK